MAGQQVTRASLQRALAVNAATKPVNVVVAAAVVVAAVVIGANWLLVVAAVVYAVLVAFTFVDEDEAERVGRREYGRLGEDDVRLAPHDLAAPISTRLARALEAESQIRRAIDGSELPFAEVGPEVRALVGAVAATARRAQLVFDYLASQDPRDVDERIEELRRSRAADEPVVRGAIAALREQRDAQLQLSRQLERFYAEMEQTVAALNTVHAEIVRMGVTAARSEEREIAGRLRGLREQVDAVSDGIGEAYERADASAARSASSS